MAYLEHFNTSPTWVMRPPKRNPDDLGFDEMEDADDIDEEDIDEDDLDEDEDLDDEDLDDEDDDDEADKQWARQRHASFVGAGARFVL